MKLFRPTTMTYNGQPTTSPCCPIESPKTEDEYLANCCKPVLTEGMCLFGHCFYQDWHGMPPESFQIMNTSMVPEQIIDAPRTESACGATYGENYVSEMTMTLQGVMVFKDCCGKQKAYQTLYGLYPLGGGCNSGHHKMTFDSYCLNDDAVPHGDITQYATATASSNLNATRTASATIDGSGQSNYWRPATSERNETSWIQLDFPGVFCFTKWETETWNAGPGFSSRNWEAFDVEILDPMGNWIPVAMGVDGTTSLITGGLVPYIEGTAIRFTYPVGLNSTDWFWSFFGPWIANIKIDGLKKPTYKKLYTYAQVTNIEIGGDTEQDDCICAPFTIEFDIYPKNIFWEEKVEVCDLTEGHLGGVCLPTTVSETEDACCGEQSCDDTRDCSSFCAATNPQEVMVENCSKNLEIPACITIEWNGEMTPFETDPIYEPPPANFNGINYALDGTAYASSEQRVCPEVGLTNPTALSSFGGGPGDALDGNTFGTWWESDRVTNNHLFQDTWWQAQPSGPFNSIRIRWSQFQGQRGWSGNFDIQCSNDGTTWTNILSGLNSVGTTSITYNFPTQNCQYLRLYFHSSGAVIDVIRLGDVQINNCVVNRPASLGNDDNSSFWLSDRFTNPLRLEPVTYMIDLETVRTVCRVEIWWWINNRKSNDFDIQGSLDGITWDTLHNETTLFNGGSTLYTFTFPAPVTYRYFRLFFKAGSSTYPFNSAARDNIGLREFRIMSCPYIPPEPYEQGNVVGCGLIVGNLTNNTLMRFKPSFCFRKNDKLCIDGVSGTVKLNGLDISNQVEPRSFIFPSLTGGSNQMILHDDTPPCTFGSLLKMCVTYDDVLL